MPPESKDAKAPNAVTWQRLAVALWIAVIAGVCVRGVVQQRTHSLYPTFAAAGSHWHAGTSLYYWGESEPGLEPYRYSPLVAAALVPFELLPPRAGGVAWRLLNACVLLAGMAAWLRSPLPWHPDAKQRAILFVMVLPLAAGSLNNAQSNPLVLGFLLLTVAAAGAGRWNRAAVWMALAASLKVYPVALGMLLAAAYPRRFAGRLLVALAAAVALPFLFQWPSYVAGQYAEWLRVLSEDDRRYWPLHMAYRDLWLLFRVAAVPLGPRGYQAIQVLSGVACAAVCVAGRVRNWEPARTLTAVLALGTCWMTLCGPATESSTFVLLAPSLAWGVLAARADHWTGLARWMPDVAGYLLFVSFVAGVSPQARNLHALGPQPLAALLLFAAYLTVLIKQLRRSAARPATGAPVARAA
jgi:hypothetical protein